MNTGRIFCLYVSGKPAVFLLAIVLCSTPAAFAQRYWDIDGATSGATPGSTAPGIWGVDNFWSTRANGTAATSAWMQGQQAVFSAGSDASGIYSITVSGNQLVSGIVFQEGTVTLSGGTLTLTNGVGSATINVASGRTAAIGSHIAGTNGLAKTGAGALFLSASNSYYGTTALSSGQLLIEDDNALGNSILTLAGGTLSASGGAHTVGNAVLISANSTISGVENITFKGNVNQTGSRTLTINNSGTTTFEGSTLTLAENNTSRTLTLNVLGGDVTIANVIQNGTGSGADGLTKSGSGTLTLTGDNTFTGNLRLNAGKLVLGSDSAAGAGTLIFANGVTVAATGGTRTIANNLSLSGNLTFGAGGDLVFTDSFDLGANRTFTVENTTTFNGVISGSGDTLTKNGIGTLVLNGNNAFGGSSDSLTVNAGIVALGHDGAVGAAANRLILNGGMVQASGGARTLANTLIITEDSALGGDQNLTFTGAASHQGGNHTLTISNSGLTTFSGSTWTLAENNSARTLTLDVAGSSGGTVISGVIRNGSGSGADALVKNGAGQLTLSGSSANTFSGGLTVNSGTVTAGKVNALGSGQLTITGATVDIGAFNQNIGALVVAGGTLDGTSGVMTAPSYQIQSGIVNARLGGSGSLTKLTPGTATITASNSYSGTTTVNAGTLFVNNASGTGTNTVTVNNGGVLAGTGTIPGKIILNSGGVISAGASVGHLMTASQTWNGSSIFTVEISDVDAGEGVGWDLLDVTGTLTLDATSADRITLDLRSLTLGDEPGEVHDFSDLTSFTWRIVRTTDGILFNPGEDENSVFDLSLGNFANDTGLGIFSLSLDNGSKDLLLKFTAATPVPEPGVNGIVAVGFVIWLAGRRLLFRK